MNLQSSLPQPIGDPSPRRVPLFPSRPWGPWFSAGLLIAGWVTGLSAAELPRSTPEKAGLSGSKLAEVDQFMERAVADQKIAGGIIAVSHNGRIAFFHTYGRMDLESGKPVQADTLFRIYSMSKAITTAAALTLYDAGKLGLEDPVAKYIPSFSQLRVAGADGLHPPSRPMTVRDLMRHTSGLTYGGDGPEAHREAFKRLKPLESVDLEEMAAKVSQIPLAYDPGMDWIYSISTDVLGRVIEVASGKSLDSFLEEAIFRPLDMVDTAFTVPPSKASRLAANYKRSPEGLKVIDAPAASKFAKQTTFFSGGGGLVSTARDYMRFLAMIERGGGLDGRRVLKPQTVDLMTHDDLPRKAYPIHFGAETRHGVGFGLGFSVRTQGSNWDPAGHLGEYGWGGAASTHYWASPNDKLIVLTLEQIIPYQWDTEFGVKKIIYDSILR
ncbi:MAG: beta-lactamase family protein [Verrucomicrobia bacterium]|nr:beta-lactamase family protein [Verrucomicrobiota bacterium]MBI3869551.1 beta-lactamase family protein [Verrucomicrobiota bacterium]